MLRTVEHHGIKVDACDCGGLWFDRGELEAWMRARRGEPRQIERRQESAPPAPPSRCPRCADLLLDRHAFLAGDFRVCRRCAGIWVDARGMAALDPSVARESGISADLVLWALRTLASCPP